LSARVISGVRPPASCGTCTSGSIGKALRPKPIYDADNSQSASLWRSSAAILRACELDSFVMIRPVYTELALFLTPFVVYAVFLVAARKGLLDPKSWPLANIAWLVIAALILMVGSFVILAHFGGSPPGSTYTPAHVEDGEFVPGKTK